MVDTFQTRTLANYLSSLQQSAGSSDLLTQDLKTFPVAYFLTAAQAAVTYASIAQGLKADTALQSVVAGTGGVVINNTDPLNPVISLAGGGSGDMAKAVYDPLSVNGNAFDMANMVESASNKILTVAERGKLAGIASGATVNDTDANLKNRANHTGTQAASTITGLATVATTGAKSDVGLGNVDNTSDANKPVSTAQQTALNLKQNAGATLTSLEALALVAGDVLYATAADTLARLPKGTANQEIRMNAAATAPEWYTPASGSSGLVLLSAQTVSPAVAAVDFTTGIDSTYDEYELHFQNAKPQDDSRLFILRTSTDGGTTFADAAASYQSVVISAQTTTVASSVGSNTSIALHSVNLGNDVNENGVSGVARLMQPSATAYLQVLSDAIGVDTAGLIFRSATAGRRLAAGPVNALRLAMTAGNIASGTFKLYGVRKS